MLINTSGAGGAGGLNFRVIGGTIQPSSASENTIWINTDTAIKEYIFSSATPSSATVGDVWIKTGINSNATFNALKKNYLYVYPSSCYQYDGSAWVSKTAKIYMDGAWKDFEKEIWLYNQGQWGLLGQFTPETSTSNASTLIPTVTFNASSININGTTAGSPLYYHTYAAWMYSQQIDLSSYESLNIEWNNFTLGYGSCGYGTPVNFTSLTAAISRDVTPTFTASAVSGSCECSNTTGVVSNTIAQSFWPEQGSCPVSGTHRNYTYPSGTLTLDLSTVNGTGTILIGMPGIRTNNYLSNRVQRDFNCNITKIWLE